MTGIRGFREPHTKGRDLDEDDSLDHRSNSRSTRDVWSAELTPRETHLYEYWEVVVRRRKLVALCVVSALLGAIFLSLLSKRTYRATVVLNVEPERWTPLDIGEKPFGAVVDPEFIPTQIAMMTGREVAERVVAQLDLTRSPEFRQPSGPLALQRDRKPLESARVAPGAVVAVALKLQESTEAVHVRGTKLVHLSYVASSPKLAADVANALAGAYLDWLLESRYRTLGRASQFLSAQIEQLRKETAEKERQLAAFGRQKDIISVDPHTNVTLQKLESLTKDYAAAVSDRVTKEARYAQLRNGNADAIADSLSDETVNQLRMEQARLEQRYAEQRNQFKPEWPAMQQLKAQIDRGRQQLDSVIAEAVAKARESVRAEYLTALRREESLAEVLRTQKTEAMDLSSNAVEYNNLLVEVQTKRALFDTLLKRQAETALSARMSGDRESNVRIVESALPGGKHTPSYERNLSCGLFIGLVLGVALAFGLEYMDRSLRSAEHVERYLKLPTLGIVPDVDEPGGTGYGYFGYGSYAYGRRKRASKAAPAAAPTPVAIELLPHAHPRSSGAEAYRALRTALLLSRPGGVKSVVVTSAFLGEGKTSTALNLAVVLSQLPGKGVLLVDADLHKPRLHEVLGVSNRVGLVSVLAQSYTGGDAIVGTSIPGLHFTPSGPASPNPSGLLASGPMQEFLALAARTFEYVIVDAPPVFSVADALVLGSRTDGVILCVKGGGTPREHVARLRDTVVRSNVPILGVILNRLPLRARAYEHGYPYYQGGYAGEVKELRAPSAASGSVKAV